MGDHWLDLFDGHTHKKRMREKREWEEELRRRGMDPNQDSAKLTVLDQLQRRAVENNYNPKPSPLNSQTTSKPTYVPLSRTQLQYTPTYSFRKIDALNVNLTADTVTAALRDSIIRNGVRQATFSEVLIPLVYGGRAREFAEFSIWVERDAQTPVVPGCYDLRVRKAPEYNGKVRVYAEEVNPSRVSKVKLYGDYLSVSEGIEQQNSLLYLYISPGMRDAYGYPAVSPHLNLVATRDLNFRANFAYPSVDDATAWPIILRELRH